MAIPAGIIKFTGTIDGISFYKTKFGWVARRKGGPDPEQMKKDKRFERVRENGKEFGACGKAVGQVRRALMPLLRESGDARMTGRMTKVFIQIKNLDSISTRGKRNVSEGLKSQEGKEMLKGFDFNSDATLGKLLKAKYNLSVNGEISFKGLIPKNDFKIPKGATHVGMKSIVLCMDFAKNLFELQQSEGKRVVLNNSAQDILLKPPVLALKKGLRLSILQICFYQEMNSKEYRLQNIELNGMGVIGVSEEGKG